MSLDDAPKYIREGLTKQDPDTLRAIAERAQQLAEKKETLLESKIEQRAVDESKHDVDLDEIDRDQAPAGATLVTKNIDDRDYYYWNWRADGTVKSEYIRPVNPAD